MATTLSVDDGAAAIAQAHQPALPAEEKIIPAPQEKNPLPAYDNNHDIDDDSINGQEPTEEELETLRRVAGAIPFNAYTVAFIELCERFSWYGTVTLCKFNKSSCCSLFVFSSK